MSDESGIAELPFDEANRTIGAIGRLPEDSAVRQCTVRLLRGDSEGALNAVKPAMIARGAASPAQAVAAWVLGRANLPPKDVDSAGGLLLDLLERQHPDGKPVTARSLSWGVGLTFGFIVLVAMLSRELPPTPQGFLTVFAVLAVAFTGATAPFQWRRALRLHNHARAEAAAALGHLGFVEAIGPLAVALYAGDRELRAASASALHELLPRLGAEHLGELGAETMHYLGRALAHPDSDLVSRILLALEQAGTSHALPYVERCARAGRTGRIRALAQRVGDVLEHRRQLEADSGRLLRPSATPEASLLVRPSAGTNCREEDLPLLLRPQISDEYPPN